MIQCDYCNKDATYNIQENLTTYKIDAYGNYVQIDSENIGVNNHYCDIHYQKEVKE